ncbi:MAG: hypothetical protein BGO01_11655 [Armatimonadetes bacterium 55-13]|nr:hypothetical protein [Armatimonadota bacterium]OJU63449.1 MAG: hypothetical protein BGO01_11655 [Armatimonadetes bacterium 55-13]
MTRTFLRTILGCSVLAGAVVASASDVLGVRLRVGYHFTQNFELKNGGSGHLEGPEVAGDFPLSKLPGIQLYATPSICFGGKLSHGGDIDGSIYRFMISAKQTITRDGFYGIVAAGAAHSESRGLNEFKDANAFVSSVTFGVPLSFKILGVTPSFEGTYYISGKDQFRGFTFGISASF